MAHTPQLSVSHQSGTICTPHSYTPWMCVSGAAVHMCAFGPSQSVLGMCLREELLGQT